MMVGNEMVMIRDFERQVIFFSKKKDVTGRTVLFLGGRKDFEEKCRRDGVSVEDTDKFLAWKKPH
jgi:hypothetical protein